MATIRSESVARVAGNILGAGAGAGLLVGWEAEGPGDQVRILAGRVRAAVHALAVWNADLLRALARLAAVRPVEGDDPAGVFDAVLAAEVAGAMGVSTQSASGQLEFASAVARRLPSALDALAAGVLDLPRLRSLEQSTHPLDDALADQVAAHVLTRGPRAHRAAFSAACRRAVHKLDPDGAAARARERRKDRRVWLDPEEDGVACLGALLPAEDAFTCYRRVDQIAATVGGP